MYTPDQASEMLKTPTSTLRRYAKQYASHLSVDATTQRNRRYTEADIATLARARELLREGKSPKQVNELLSVVSDGERSPDKTLALIPSISSALTEALDTARLLRVQVDAHEQRMSDAERRLSEMADKLAQLESEQRISWYQRLISLIRGDKHTPK